jgi:hypothetical protein
MSGTGPNPALIAIPENLALDVRDLEATLAASLAYWDPRYHSVSGDLQRWQRFAATLADYRGYNIDEYLHDLGVRDSLHHSLEASRPPLRHWLVRAVDRIDDAYLRATDLDVDDLMWGGMVEEPCHWWHRRLPRNAVLRAEIDARAPQMRASRRDG